MATQPGRESRLPPRVPDSGTSHLAAATSDSLETGESHQIFDSTDIFVWHMALTFRMWSKSNIDLSVCGTGVVYVCYNGSKTNRQPQDLISPHRPGERRDVY